MTAIKYQTTDGKVFESSSQAMQQQAMLDMQEWFTLHQIDPEMEGSPAPGRFTRWMHDNKRELKEMLEKV